MEEEAVGRLEVILLMATTMMMTMTALRETLVDFDELCVTSGRAEMPEKPM